MLKIKVWQAILIALFVSLELGMGLGYFLYVAGH